MVDITYCSVYWICCVKCGRTSLPPGCVYSPYSPSQIRGAMKEQKRALKTSSINGFCLSFETGYLEIHSRKLSYLRWVSGIHLLCLNEFPYYYNLNKMHFILTWTECSDDDL